MGNNIINCFTPSAINNNNSDWIFRKFEESRVLGY